MNKENTTTSLVLLSLGQAGISQDEEHVLDIQSFEYAIFKEVSPVTGEIVSSPVTGAIRINADGFPSDILTRWIFNTYKFYDGVIRVIVRGKKTPIESLFFNKSRCTKFCLDYKQNSSAEITYSFSIHAKSILSCDAIINNF